MDRVARLAAAERSALFSETAARMRTTPAVVEKDFWVTWVLDRLFQQPELARLLMFKGGTSLSKVYPSSHFGGFDTENRQSGSVLGRHCTDA